MPEPPTNGSGFSLNAALHLAVIATRRENPARAGQFN
jgi:hypothetical protein